MTDQEYINSLIDKARAAQEIFMDYNQEQVDEAVRVIGKVCSVNAEMLAREAVEETGMGDVAAKVVKLQKGPLGLWRWIKDKKSVGIIEEDKENGIVVIAKPFGVIADITPSTNPSTTACSNSMMLLKGRNAVIVGPHPQAQKSTAHAVELMREELAKIGAPEDMIQVVDDCTLERSQILMASCDSIVATGGNFMVNAAYSSGKPSFGVGQGNEQTIIDAGYGNYDLVVNSIIGNRMYDLGMPCTGDNSIFIPAAEKDDILAKFQECGALLIDDAETIDRIRNVLFSTGVLNRAIVGKTPEELAPYFDIEVPAGTKVLLVKGSEPGAGDMMNKEILCPMIRFFTYEKFEDAVAGAAANLYVEGAGHSACLWSRDKEHIEYAGMKLPTCRLLVEQTGAGAAGNTPNNGLNPTLSISCGSWGGNALSENLSYYHFLNMTRISYNLPDRAPLDMAEWNA